jgi:autotransporter-associated beta strand protein
MKTFFHHLSKTIKLILSVPSTPLLSSPIRTINAVNPMKTKNLFSQQILMLLCLMMVSMWGWGQKTYTGANNGNWTTNTNWSGGTVPGTNDQVVIPTAINVVLNTSFTSSASGSITMQGTGSITIAGGNNDNFGLIVNGTITFSGTSANQLIVSTSSGNPQTNNTFTLGSTANLLTANTNGVAGTNCSISTLTSGSRATVTLSTTANYQFNGAGNQSTSGLPATINNLTISGSGTKTLSAATTVSATLAINGGATFANATFALSAAAITLECGGSGSTLSGTGLLTLGGNVTVNKITGTGVGATINCPVALTNAATRNFIIADETTVANDLTISGIVSTSGNLTKSGAGTLLLSGANTYTGLTTVSVGKLALGVSSSASTSGPLGTTASGTTVTSGAVLDLNGFSLSSSATEALSLNGTGISSGGALTNRSSTASNYIGLITIASTASIVTDAGDINLTNTGAFASDGFALTIGGSGNGTISGAFTANSQGITKIGGGTWKLSGANMYGGATLISAGTLQLGSTAALGVANGLVTVSSGAALDLNGFTLSVSKNTTINGTGITSLGAITNSSLSAAIYPGIITLASDASIVGETGSIAISNTSQLNGSGFTLTLGGATGGSFSSALSTGSGGLTKIGTGTWTINALNFYTGSTTISAGTLKLGIGGTGNSADRGPLGTSGVGTVVAAGAVLDLNGNSIETSSIPEALTLNGSGILGGGALTNTGAAATFNGAITLGSASTITATSSGSLTCSGAVAGAFGLTLGGAGTGTMSGVISTPTSLTKNGVGSWTLSGTNTYTGTSTVSAGTLVLNNTAALGATSNSFVVASGAKVDIVSNVTVGALTLNSLGTSSGTWGFTGSGATFINATFFTNSTTGKITVSTDTRATPTVTITGNATPYTYNGSTHGPTTSTNTGTGVVTYSYSGTPNTGTFTTGAILPTNAGTYSVTATSAVSADGFYKSSSSSATAFTITKASPTATLAVSNSPVTYSGAAQSAIVGYTSLVLGTVTTIATGGPATQTNAGSYAVTASFVPTDSANYNTLTLQSAGNFVISPAALLITANNASKCVGATYNLGTSAFTSSGLRSPETIGSVSLTSSGSGSGAFSGSYSIVPSAATGGTFLASNYSITYSNGVLTVNPTNTAGTASSTPNVCINTALTTINHTTTAATGIGAATGLPAGVTATFASNTLTISGTPTVSGTFNYSIPLTGGCGSVIATGTITVSPASAGGTVAGSATVCNGTNSATLIVSGQIGTITRWESSLDNFATAGTSIANTTNSLTASDLTATTYYRAVVTSGACASVYSTVATITVNSCINKWKGSVSTDWNTPGNWILNLVPAVDANLVFDDSPANDCYLDQDRSVTTITNAQGVYGIVLNGNKLTLKGNLLFSGGATIDASASNSTMQFSGSAIQSIQTGVFKNATVYNLEVTNSNNVVLSGNLRLLNHLTATTGLLDAFTNSPTITYSGNTLQTIEGNQFLGGKINNLTVDNGVGVNLNTNFTITNTLVINTGKKLSVSSLYQLTALGTISNNGSTSGLILKSNALGTASLIHNTDNVPATVERYISGPVEGWHFLSAPISNQGISGSWLPLGSYGTGNTATGTGFDLYVWDEPSFSFKYKLDTTPIGWNSIHSGSNFSAGRGYLYSVQETNPTKEFKGNLNNGAVSYPITFTETLDPKLYDLKGFNLVGNPYPSSVDWQAASGWDRTNLEVSGGGCDMWVWNPTANNYGVFNSASGVGTNSISRYLAPMQGYFVKAANNGNLVFDNRVREHTGAGNWFKNTGIKNTGIKNPVIRITVESEEGNGADEALLQFGYSDSNQGTSKLFSHVSSAPSLYLNLEDKKYSVRYLTTTAENNAVPMEFKAGKEGVYKLLFNFDSNEFDFIQLEDRLLKTATSVKSVSAYLFKSSKEDSVSRFVLHFTAAEIPTKKELNGLVYMDGSQLAIDLKGINGSTEIKLFDIAGQLIVQKYLEGNGLTKLDLNLATQILLVRLTNAKGASSTKVFFSPLKQ